jgi:outer membrane receptor protein involved in Fe transport
MKSFVLLLFSFCFFQFVYSQTATVKGKITDRKSKETLPGVNIISEDKTGGSSDVNGNYSISLNPGKHQLSYTFIGYKNELRSIEVHAGETISINVEMNEEIEVISEIVVSAGKFEQKLSDVTVSMEVIKPSIIENTNTISMDAVISQIPGVDVMDDQPSIRGGSGYSYGAGSRVLMLVDDMPILSADIGDVKWNFIPTENVSQIEVIKGASSALFGSSALNGVINMRTAYPKDQPETKVTIFNGMYMNPERKELIWWGSNQPLFQGASFLHSEKIKNLDLVVGGNVFSDDGYREFEKEERIRGNFNLRYRDAKIDGLSYGLNGNYMNMDKTEFFLWQNADSGAYRQDGSIASRSIGSRLNLDPFITYYNKNGHRHSLKGRYFNTINNVKDDTAKNSRSDMYYIEYQYQRNLKNNLNWTIGAMTTYAEIVAPLFGNHFSNNISLFTQLDKKIGLWNFSAGLRAEYFRIDKEESKTVVGTDTINKLPIQPVLRLGVSYQLAEHTFLRTSYGQGYRFPTVAEKFTQTNVGMLNIFPNVNLQPETGWSAELGLKQGLKLSGWKGYIDIAGFWTEYHEMMEFTFGIYDPKTFRVLDVENNPEDSAIFMSYAMQGQYQNCLGFQSRNIGNAQITGVDITITGTGKLFGLPTTLLAGYTYTNPIDLNVKIPDSLKSTKANILKYRNYHSAKADIEVNYKKISSGLSMVYTSKMINIDNVFEEPLFEGSTIYILPGLKEYREKHNKGHIVFDFRVSYTMDEHSKLSFVIKNLFNKEYMGRPGDIRPPRNLSLQYIINF